MKKSLLLAALVFAAAPGFAQTVSPTVPATAQQPDPMVERRAQYLAKELGLSADQLARLGPILQAQRQDMQAMRNRVTTGGRQRGTGADLKNSQARYLEQIKAVLTPAQYTRFTAMQEEQREKMRARRAEPGGASMPQ
ncbi:MAG: hypothetical protein JWR44_750 [Hymenobacter sp.]|nr:hypothetical protein [Hymenobacter sp.]